MSNSSRTEGKTFVPESEYMQKQVYTGRTPKTFVPSDNSSSNEPPESITVGERLPHVADFSNIQLDALPIKGLKAFGFGFAALLISLLGWEIYSVLQSALQAHWLLASLYLFLLVLVSGLAARVLISFMMDRQGIDAAQQIRDQATRLQESSQFGNASTLIEALGEFFAYKPQALHWQRCMKNMPDYASDHEAMVYIEQVFLQPLDDEALNSIYSHSIQNGGAVALSPWASLDMAISLWRCIKMIDSIGQLYGARPSLRNRYKLLRKVMHQLVFTGASELMADQLASEMGASTLTGIASARLGQGLGVGIYTAKIGITAIEMCRPLPFSAEKPPELRSLITPLVKKIQQIFGFK